MERLGVAGSAVKTENSLLMTTVYRENGQMNTGGT